MKNLSLKMDDPVFNDTEKITSAISKNRNRCINDAIAYSLFNLYYEKLFSAAE